MNRAITWIGVAAWLCAGGLETAAALPQEAQELLAKASDLESYKASFSIEATDPKGEILRLNGTILYQRPNRRRVEIREGESAEISQLLVSDGKVEWQYVPRSKAAYRMRNPKEAAGPHRPYGEVKEETVRFVERAEESGEAVVRLEADPSEATLRTAPVPIRSVRLEIAEQDGLVRKMEMLDESGRPVLTQRFTQVELSVPVEDTLFSFTLPEGTAVMDIPSEQATAP